MRTSYDAPDTAERPRYWGHDAACKGYQPADTFFPKTYGGTDVFTVAAAKAVCERCPVRVDCLTHALDCDERDGVWGGFTPDERSELKKQWQRSREGPHAAA